MASASGSKKTTKKKEKRVITRGNVFIQATFNNIIVTATDMKGDIIFWTSSGSLGFKAAKRSTPYAAQVVIEKFVEKLRSVNMQILHLYIKGPGIGRESAIRSLLNFDFKILSITDRTPVAHNGCRPRKARRG